MPKKLFMLSKLAKIIIFIVTLLHCYIVTLPLAFASPGDSFVTIVNPVRGGEFWGLTDQKPQDAVVSQYRLIKDNNLVATWLLRFDAIEDSQIVSFLQKIDKQQELGIFLEITPSLARAAGVPYKEKGIFWHDANRVFLSGYKIEDRKKLIDIIFDTFLGKFGFYPKSVGAWHIDASSASYMREKYGIASTLICADQFSTDNYQIWGQPWGVAYYPSKFNIQVPAQTSENKLDLVVFQWALRDLAKGYGGSANESTFSVQANDYLKHDLGIDYFQELVQIYTDTSQNSFGQITVGLENDNDWGKYGQEYENQIMALVKMKETGKLEVVTMSNFAFWYKNHFPLIFPQMEIKSQDAEWISAPRYRLGLIAKDGKEYIRDLRIYSEQWPEPYLSVPNAWPDLSLSVPAEVDTVRFPEKPAPYEAEIVQEKLNLPFSPPKIALLLYCSIALLLSAFLFLKNKCLGILVSLGTISQSLTMIKSGLLYSFGMGFWGPNGHDGIWHIALINQIAKGRFSHPTLAHFNLLNYHFGFDLLVALVHRVTNIPVINLYFQILPVIFSLLLGILTYLLVKKWIKSETAALLSTFFVYFGGSWGWLVNWLKNKTLGGESLFWANQAVSTLINPPYVLSVVLMLFGFYLLLDCLEKPKKKLLIILALLFGSLIEVKVYAGIIILGSLGILGLIRVIRKIRERRDWQVFQLFLGVLLVTIVVFLPFNRQASSLLVFSPLWFPHTMLAFQDRLGWIRLENARQAYLATGQCLKWIFAEGLALVIFVLGNLGMRILGIGWLVSWSRGDKGNKGDRGKRRNFEVFLVLVLLVSLSFTLTFIQKGNPWNTIQFFYYFQFFMGILAGVWLARFLSLFKNRLVKLALLLIVVLLTIPTTLGTLFYNYLPSRPPARVSFDELGALEFLSRQPDGVVLTYPYNPSWREKFSEPKPLYAYETTAYVSAFSGKQTFLEDEMNLEISAYNWRPRREEEIRFFVTDNKEWANTFLRDNKIRYIYLVKGQQMNLGENDIGAEKVFENGEVKIYTLVNADNQCKILSHRVKYR